jgi:bacteriocin biosynthesis cyclodehydratase domain-containing protein
MAATVRLITNAVSSQAAAKPSVLLFSAGAFGNAVARYLGVSFSDLTQIDASTPAMPDVNECIADVCVIASRRPLTGMLETIDTIFHQQQRTFVPLIVDSTVLRLGPIVVPGSGSCWTCWQRRSLQHAARPEETAMVSNYYETHPDAGPDGYLEPFAMMGAARITQVLEASKSLASQAGHVWQIDMMTRLITTSIVEGVHDCPRCGLHRPPETRSFADMQRELASWQED